MFRIYILASATLDSSVALNLDSRTPTLANYESDLKQEKGYS